jgi:hypothetical protein
MALPSNKKLRQQWQHYRKMSTSELRRKWIDYWNECDRIRDRYNKWWREERRRLTAEWRENPILYPRVKLPSYPLYRPPHGGLSTGPKTQEGKRRSALNGFKRKSK